MKNILKISVLCLLPLFTQAQTFTLYNFYFYKNIQKIGPLSEKTLVVKEYEYKKKELNKFNKKGVLDKKMKALKAKNDKLLKIVKENWKYNKNIVLSSTFSEDVEYQKSDKFIYLDVKKIRESKKHNVGEDDEYTESHNTELLRIKGKRKLLNIHSKWKYKFNDLELSSALKYLQKGFEASDKQIKGEFFPNYINKNASKIKNKILLIPNNNTILSSEQIQELYGFNVKKVSHAEILNKIASKSTKHVYYLPQYIAGSFGNRFNHLIYSCENQEPIAIIEGNKKHHDNLLDKTLKKLHELVK